MPASVEESERSISVSGPCSKKWILGHANSSVRTVTSLRMDFRGIVLGFPPQSRNFCLLQSIQTWCGSHPASYSMDAGGPFSGIKWPKHEAERSHLLLGLGMHWAAPLLSHVSTWWLFKRKNNFVFYLYSCNNWRKQHTTELKIVAGCWGKTHIMGKAKHCVT